MSSSVTASTSPEPKLPGRYQRKLTEARREQNRRSQRIWRDKQKQRRDDEIKLRVQQELEKRGEENANRSVPMEVITESLAPGERQTETDDHLTDPGINVTEREETIIPEPVLPLGVALYYYVPPVPGAEDYRHSWPVPDDFEFKTYALPPGVTPRASSLSSLSSSGSPSESTSPPSLFSISRPSVAGASSRRSYPSPYLNNLQLVGESCFAATMSIAESLGISMVAYVNDFPSPFSTSSNAGIHTIPVDLRPTAYQLIIPHPSYLDCIPFPHFRSMAIYLSSVKKLDHCSLFLDLMHDGMVCWGRERASARHGRSMRDSVAWNKRSWEVRRWFWRKWSWIARMTVEAVDASDPGTIAQPTIEDFDDEDGMLSGSQWWWSLHDDEEDNMPTEAPSSNFSEVPAQEGEEFGGFLSRMHTCNVAIRKHEEQHLLHNWV